MAKTTMAQEVRVEGAISGTGATGSSKRPFQRLVMAFLACCATLSIWQAAYTPPRSGEGHGLDLRPATGHFIHRRAASHDRRSSKQEVFVYAPVA